MPPGETEDQRHAENQRRLTEVESTVAAIEQQLEKLSRDLHAVKGNMAGNTALTQETLAGVDAIKGLIGQLDIPALREMADALNSMKGGVHVLGWLERPAKWLATMAGLAAAIYGLWKIK
jgi:hypothetical protein